MIMAVMIIVAMIHLIAPYLAAATVIAFVIWIVSRTPTDKLKK